MISSNNKRKYPQYIILVAAIVAFILSFMTGCSSLERSIKNAKSDYGGGLNREIIIYDTIGNELYRQEGKFDIDYQDGRVLYDDEQGLRHQIYFQNGIIIVNELEK